MTRDLALTFAGGGNRAFYQLGLMRAWGPRLFPRTAAVVSCSAGACVITSILAGREEEAYEFWVERRRDVRRNIDWGSFARGGRLTPHAPIFRDTLLHTFAAGGFERVRAAPFPVYVVASALPRLLPTTLAVALGIGIYSAERSLRRAPHPVLPRLLVRFAPVVVDARSCESAQELTDLILASSATPPFTPVGRFRGQRLLDGGMIDNVPAFVADDLPDVRRNVILMTRPYHPSVIGHQGNRLYVAPTRPTPIGRWDYTSPERLAQTIEMGEREATLHAPELERFLTDEGLGPLRPGEALKKR